MINSARPGRRVFQARLVVPVCLGLLVLLLGYVSLLMWWELGVNPPGLPGLFHYPDATWGDGFLLPVLALFLWTLIGRLDKTAAGWPTWLAGAAGAVGGGILIFTWWRDPHPAPN